MENGIKKSCSSCVFQVNQHHLSPAHSYAWRFSLAQERDMRQPCRMSCTDKAYDIHAKGERVKEARESETEEMLRRLKYS